jgi:hypothetical protein
MGAIKDIVDLTTQLCSSVQDRETAAKILAIQTLILSVQKDDAALVSENFDLKKKIFDLEQQHAESERRHSEEMTALNKSHTEEIAKMTKKSVGPNQAPKWNPFDDT